MSGLNRATEVKRGTFISGGGSKLYGTNTLLNGSIKNNLGYGSATIFISSQAQLDGEFFRAEPLIDYSKSVLAVDGSVKHITNSSNAKRLTIRMLEGDWSVADGDPLACFDFCQNSDIKMGWDFTLVKYVNGKKMQFKYIDCALQQVPQQIASGNDVPVYEAVFVASDMVASEGSDSDNAITQWAVGNKNAIEGVFSPLIHDKLENGYVNSNAKNGANMVDINDDTTNDPPNYDNQIPENSDIFKG